MHTYLQKAMKENAEKREKELRKKKTSSPVRIAATPVRSTRPTLGPTSMAALTTQLQRLQSPEIGSSRSSFQNRSFMLWYVTWSVRTQRVCRTRCQINCKASKWISQLLNCIDFRDPKRSTICTKIDYCVEFKFGYEEILKYLNSRCQTMHLQKKY